MPVCVCLCVCVCVCVHLLTPLQLVDAHWWSGVVYQAKRVIHGAMQDPSPLRFIIAVGIAATFGAATQETNAHRRAINLLRHAHRVRCIVEHAAFTHRELLLRVWRAGIPIGGI